MIHWQCKEREKNGPKTQNQLKHRGGNVLRGGRWCEHMREKRNAARFVSGRRGTLGRTVIQRYSWLLRSRGSTASWEVWEGRLTRDTEEGFVQRASVCYDWVTGLRCVKWRYVQVNTGTLGFNMLLAHVKQMRVVNFSVRWQEWEELLFPPTNTLTPCILSCFNCIHFCKLRLAQQHVEVMISQKTFTHNLFKSKRDRKMWNRNIEKGKRHVIEMVLSKLGWKRTEIAFGAAWLRL